MLRLPLILFFFIVLIFSRSEHALAVTANAASGQYDYGQSTASQLYDQAKFYHNQLQANEFLDKSRESWLKGTRNFRKLYLMNPTSELAPMCLFMLGRMYRQMYENFKLRIDLDESLANFQELVRLFPGHRLADDAYVAIGLVSMELKQEPQKAADAFEAVVTRYPHGDMRTIAAEKLKILSKDFNIPLPQILTDNRESEELNTILPVKYWSSNDYTRIVVIAAGPITYKETLLEPKNNQPRRMCIDFQNSYIEPQNRAPISIKDGLLKKIRTSQYSSDTVRVELNIESLDSYKIFSLPEPFRVVIDIRGERNINAIATKRAEISSPEIKAQTKAIVDPATPPEIKAQSKVIVGSVTPTEIKTQSKAIQPTTVSPGKPISPEIKTVDIKRDKQKHVFPQKSLTKQEEPEKAEEKETPTLAQQLGLRVKRIVLDPGHGGKDPGATSNGLMEKDIVLTIAQKLKPLLAKELACDVILTRTSDIFLPLEERTAIANTQSADLFISLHINAHPSNKVRGAETYFLNLSTNADAMRVAAMENATSTHQMSDLEDILSNILKNSKIDESSRLAQKVHESILAGIDKNKYGEIKNLGIKQAPFYVLIGAEMPSILLEIAFISNEEDAKNLQNPSYIESISREITKGIKAYVETNTASL